MKELKGFKEGCIGINSGVKQWCIVSPWLFNVYMDAVMREMKLVLCSESEEDLRAMVGRFVEVCRISSERFSYNK